MVSGLENSAEFNYDSLNESTRNSLPLVLHLLTE